MTDWSPFRDSEKPDASRGGSGAALSLADIMVDPPADNQRVPIAHGRYRAKLLTPNLQYLDCSLTTTDPFVAAGMVAPGLLITHAFSGSWHSEVDGMPLDLASATDTVVYGTGRPLPFLEKQTENTSIEMASLYVSADFFASDWDETEPPDVLTNLLQGEGLIAHRLNLAGSLQRLLRQMFDTPIDGYLARLSMTSLGLSALVELATALGVAPGPATASRRHRELAAALREYLDRHITDLPSVPDMAQRFATNESTLRRAFKASYGMSITEYARLELLKWARCLLREGHLQIAEVAYRCGFSSPANFTAAYRRHYGYPPGAERRKNA